MKARPTAYVSVLGHPAAKTAGAVARRIMRAKRFYQRSRYGGLSEAWRQAATEVVGEEVARRTRVGDVQHGRVIVEVDCPVLLQELSGFMQRELLSRLQALPGGEDAAELRFRMGRATGNRKGYG